MNTKILLISYLFPPVSGPRSIRWAQMTKHLSNMGYDVDVLTINPEKGFGTFDENSLELLCDKVKITRTYPGILYKLNNKFLPVSGNDVKDGNSELKRFKVRPFLKTIYKKIFEPMLIPDKTVEWLPWGARELYKMRNNNYDLIISSSVPYTAHILGYIFKKWTRTKWIADYGDPWGFNPFCKSWRLHIDKIIEKHLLKSMDAIIVTNQQTADGFTQHYRTILKLNMISVVSQGFEKKTYEEIIPERGNRFRIIYTGNFYGGLREPNIFFDALEQLRELDLEVLIAGDDHSYYQKLIKEKKLEKIVHFIGYQTHSKIVALQKGADVLLLLGNPNGYQLPGKIFEYFGACRPILTIKLNENDVATEFIERHRRGVIVSNQTQDIKKAIRLMYELKKNGKLEETYDCSYLDEYSWCYLATKLDKILRKII